MRGTRAERFLPVYSFFTTLIGDRQETSDPRLYLVWKAGEIGAGWWIHGVEWRRERQREREEKRGRRKLVEVEDKRAEDKGGGLQDIESVQGSPLAIGH